MGKLIDKDILAAEIIKLQGKVYDGSSYCTGWQHALRMLEIELNTIEAKEVDLEKDKPVTNALERAALLHYPKMSRISEPHGFIPTDNESHYLGDANEDNRKAFIVGAQWQKEQYQPTIELAENHAYFAGSENTREKLIEKACEWLKDNWRKHVWLDGDNIIHFGLWENDFRKAMEE